MYREMDGNYWKMHWYQRFNTAHSDMGAIASTYPIAVIHAGAGLGDVTYYVLYNMYVSLAPST